jgi:hypothetical protein
MSKNLKKFFTNFRYRNLISIIFDYFPINKVFSISKQNKLLINIIKIKYELPFKNFFDIKNKLISSDNLHSIYLEIKSKKIKNEFENEFLIYYFIKNKINEKNIEIKSILFNEKILNCEIFKKIIFYINYLQKIKSINH